MPFVLLGYAEDGYYSAKLRKFYGKIEKKALLLPKN